METSLHTTLRWASFVLTVVVASESSLPAEASEQEKPRCALIATGDVPVSALLEAKLLPRDSEIWLERRQIDQVLAEQELQAAFGALGGADRAALGRLLKADVLVLLRSRVQNKQPCAELVVAESEGGLRLLARSVPLTGMPDADAAGCENLVVTALAKHHETIRQVYAVPPFISKNLSHRLDHLQGAYARIVESALLRTPGIVVVEIEEAQAIAEERTLNHGTERLQRREPIIVYGDFRHATDDDQGRVSFHVKLLCGKDVLAESSESVEAESIADHLGYIARQAIAVSSGLSPQPATSGSDAEQLAARGAEFLQIGQWKEAAELTEAALLVTEGYLAGKTARAGTPDESWRLWIHERSIRSYRARLRQAVIAYGGLARDFFWERYDPDERIRGVDYYLRGLEHLEEFVRVTGNLKLRANWPWCAFVRDFEWCCNGLEPTGPHTIVHDYAEQAKKREHEVLMRIIRLRVERGFSDDVMFVPWAFRQFSKQEHFDLAYRLLFEFRDFPGFEDRYYTYACRNYTPQILDCPEGQAFVARLENSEHAKLRAAGAKLRYDCNTAGVRFPTTPPRRIVMPAPVPDDQPLKFTEVKLTIDTPGGGREPLKYLAGCMSVSTKTDVVWSHRGVYLMREPGLLTPAWQGPEGTNCRDVVFDERYVWVYLEGPGRLGLLAIEPQSGKTCTFDATNGLPADWAEPSRLPRMSLASFAPGRVCIATHIENRSSIALAEVQWGQEPHLVVDVILEARHAVFATTSEEGADTELAVQMTVRTVADGPLSEPSTKRYVLIYRHRFPPLLYDPQSGEIRAYENPFKPIAAGQRPSNEIVDYFLGYPYRKFSLKFTCCPTECPDVDSKSAKWGHLVHLHGQPYLLASRCWRVDLEAGTAEPAGEVPWYFYDSEPGQTRSEWPDRDALCLDGVFNSSHYGLVVNTRSANGKTALFQITVDEPNATVPAPSTPAPPAPAPAD